MLAEILQNRYSSSSTVESTYDTPIDIRQSEPQLSGAAGTFSIPTSPPTTAPTSSMSRLATATYVVVSQSFLNNITKRLRNEEKNMWFIKIRVKLRVDSTLDDINTKIQRSLDSFMLRITCQLVGIQAPDIAGVKAEYCKSW